MVLRIGTGTDRTLKGDQGKFRYGNANTLASNAVAGRMLFPLQSFHLDPT
jgi:hypothetical protein